MPAPVIHARQIGRRFGNFAALTAIDAEVGAGEGVALLGPNGAGKTTLLRIFATLLTPSAGVIRIFGEDAAQSRGALRHRIGVLSHQSFLYPELSVAENLDFYARLYGVEDRHARVRSLIDRTGLLGWGNRPVRTLSRGLEQRCAIARALLHRPSLLLLDEPFSGLDRGATAMLSELVNEFRREGGTVIMSTHDSDAAATLCDRGYLLRGGRTVWQGRVGGSARDEFETAYSAAFG